MAIQSPILPCEGNFILCRQCWHVTGRSAPGRSEARTSAAPSILPSAQAGPSASIYIAYTLTGHEGEPSYNLRGAKSCLRRAVRAGGHQSKLT